MLLDAQTIARLRATQESSMHHVCSIEPYIVAEDGTISYGTAFETVCGFELTTTTLNSGSAYEDIAAEAKLRLPVGVPIGMKDRVTLTASFGEQLTTPRVFEVTGLPGSFGPSGQVVNLEEVYL